MMLPGINDRKYCIAAGSRSYGLVKTEFPIGACPELDSGSGMTKKEMVEIVRLLPDQLSIIR